MFKITDANDILTAYSYDLVKGKLHILALNKYMSNRIKIETDMFEVVDEIFEHVRCKLFIVVSDKNNYKLFDGHVEKYELFDNISKLKLGSCVINNRVMRLKFDNCHYEIKFEVAND